MPYSYPQLISRRDAIRQIGHLIPGAFAFAAIAGYVNSISLGFFLSPVSHMTGSLSYLGIELSKGFLREAAVTAGIIAAYATGAAISGCIIGAQNLLPARKYGVPLICETLLLTAATVLLVLHSRLGLPLAAMACGVQNAMTSSYCGLMIRTTHVTGTVTDIGVMLGHWLRHGTIDYWKLRFLIILVLGFGIGVWTGALADRFFGPISLGFAAMLSAAGFVAMACFSASGGQIGSILLESSQREGAPRSSSFPGME